MLRGTRNFCTWHNRLTERHILCYETTIAGVPKSWAPGRRGDEVLCGGVKCLWVLGTELALYHPSRPWNFEAASRFWNFVRPVIWHWVLTRFIVGPKLEEI